MDPLDRSLESMSAATASTPTPLKAKKPARLVQAKLLN
jgi:hypothetical protein